MRRHLLAPRYQCACRGIRFGGCDVKYADGSVTTTKVVPSRKRLVREKNISSPLWSDMSYRAPVGAYVCASAMLKLSVNPCSAVWTTFEGSTLPVFYHQLRLLCDTNGLPKNVFVEMSCNQSI